MMFALSTLLLAETVLAYELPPPAQVRILKENDLAMKLSADIAGANLDELKILRTDQSMTQLNNYVENQYIDRKFDMVEEGLEKKLEEAISATTATPKLSIKDEEKMIADQIIDRDIDQTIKDPKLASLAKAVEHEISNTVIDSLEERLSRTKSGEEVSDEVENKKLVKEIVDKIMTLVKDAPEEKKAELEIALQKTFEEEVGKDIKGFYTKEGKQRALQSVAGQVAGLVSGFLPAPAGGIVDVGVQVAETVANGPLLNLFAGLVDNLTNSQLGSIGGNIFGAFFGGR